MLGRVTTLRPVDPDADLDALFSIAYACELAVVAEPDTTREDINSLLTSPDADLAQGTRAAITSDGSILGFVAVEVDEAGHEVFADTYVSPGADGSTWDLLLSHATTYATDHVAELPADERPGWAFAGGCYSIDAVYAAALTRAGLAPVRRFHTLAVTFDSAAPPVAPDVPMGVILTVVGDDEDATRTAHALWEESFVGHWRHVRRPYEEFMAHSRSRSYDPTQWWIGSVDGVAAGVCLGNEHLASLGWSYVSTLGVLEKFRGQGLGRLLLETFFAQAYERGRIGVKLGVDTENGTGAPALYAGVGMTPSRIIDAWERTLA